MSNYVIRLLIALLLTIWAAPLAAQPQTAAGVPRQDCFPLESLPAPLRSKAEELLLKALDSETLYTIVGGLKPMSSGFATYHFSVANPDLREIEEARQILATWRCGETLFADVHHFAKTAIDSKTKLEMRFAEAMVYHRWSAAAALKKHAAFFAPYGLSANAHPVEVALAVEYSAPGPRWRGYGYLFGYPDYAVDFFVRAGEEQEKTGQFVKREFYSVPTYVADQRRFVWAVPVGHQERDEDRAIKQQAEKILAAYRERRGRYIGEGKKGVSELLRDWFDDGKGVCQVSNARFAATGRAATAR